MSEDRRPDPASESVPLVDPQADEVEEMDEEHAHSADGAIPEDSVEETRVHQENAPRERVGNEGV
ncbi:hypothetical protein [Tessaracoccus sp. ZS01]|uniref:hypothetical protein n=1 Tax=Tessaracoccus sp. ZS01 TaxID=1906324 RepID=UPI00096F3FF7|nr:hypothetical protein [Tessaracoccus sp. ZS01]MCG6566504.1 hypothetical protein [Tessaracoccus sp. ZS01]OMG58946.1 hypothetical protein BJN44_02520 [Tessaracoccus sp. ZS01]